MRGDRLLRRVSYALCCAFTQFYLKFVAPTWHPLGAWVPGVADKCRLIDGVVRGRA